MSALQMKYLGKPWETLSKLGWTDPLDINLADRGVGGEVKNLLCQDVESEVVVNRPFSISL